MIVPRYLSCSTDSRVYSLTYRELLFDSKLVISMYLVLCSFNVRPIPFATASRRVKASELFFEIFQWCQDYLQMTSPKVPLLSISAYLIAFYRGMFNSKHARASPWPRAVTNDSVNSFCSFTLQLTLHRVALFRIFCFIYDIQSCVLLNSACIY